MTLTSGTFAAGTITSIPIAGSWTNNGGTFTPGSSTVTFNSTTAAQNIFGTAASQTFNNLTVSKSGQTLTGGGSTTTLTLNGNFAITAGTFAAGTTTTMNVAGNWANSGTFTAGGSTVVFNGNDNTQTLTGTTTFNNLTSNHTGTGSVTAAGSSLTVTGLLRIQAGTFTSSSTLTNVQIDSGASLASDGSTMNVSGNWTNNGGTFTPNGNTVNFNGGAAQAINGTAASQTFNNFTVNKGGGALSAGGSTTSITTNNLTMTLGTFTAPATLDINGNTLLTAGTLTAGANITAAGNWTNNGGVLTPGSGTVTFDGGAGQTIGGTTATTFNNLTNSDAGGIAMNNDNTVSGVLALSASDITVAATKTLTQPGTNASAGAFDVVGSVKRTGAPNLATGTALTFGNPFVSISFLAQGTTPTDITVNLVKAAPSGGIGFPTAVNRTYTITPTGGSGFSATLRLHYLDTELNSNDEATMTLWRFDAGTTLWKNQGFSTRDTTVNWVEKTGVTQFSPWTFNSTFPTAEPATISGRITTPNGSPLGGAAIHLNGAASRTAITDGAGNYRFENLETDNFYTVTPSLVNYSFSPASRSFSLIGNMTDAGFTGNSDASQSANAIDTAEYFVRQQYLDFLGREPEQGGFEFWTSQFNVCNSDATCIRNKRIDVSAAFFASVEFQQTGSYIYGLYAGTLGRTLNYGEFNADRSQVLGGPNLDQAKTAFAESFVQRTEFTSRYPVGMSREQFVDAVLQTMQQRSGIDPASLRNKLLGDYDTGGRALVVRHASEASLFVAAEYNKAFVLMEYFGYLRRDIDQGGYDFWLNALNQTANNYRGMVCSFLTSTEYQLRFATVITHNNGECGP